MSNESGIDGGGDGSAEDEDLVGGMVEREHLREGEGDERAAEESDADGPGEGAAQLWGFCFGELGAECDQGEADKSGGEVFEGLP